MLNNSFSFSSPSGSDRHVGVDAPQLLLSHSPPAFVQTHRRKWSPSYLSADGRAAFVLEEVARYRAKARIDRETWSAA